MDTITQEQQERLEGFTEQRDNLVGEINELTPQRDSLNSQINEGTTYLTTLTSEIADNELKVKVSAEEKGKAMAEHKAAFAQLIDEENSIGERIESAKKVLVDTLGLVSGAKSSLDEILTFASALHKDLDAIKGDIKTSADAVFLGAQRVADIVHYAESVVDEFNKNVTAKEAANEVKRVQLDARESALNQREAALNVSYDSVVKSMNKDGLKLSELKPSTGPIPGE